MRTEHATPESQKRQPIKTTSSQPWRCGRPMRNTGANASAASQPLSQVATEENLGRCTKVHGELVKHGLLHDAVCPVLKDAEQTHHLHKVQSCGDNESNRRCSCQMKLDTRELTEVINAEKLAECKLEDKVAE